MDIEVESNTDPIQPPSCNNSKSWNMYRMSENSQFEMSSQINENGSKK